jgi:hypothetical protein
VSFGLEVPCGKDGSISELVLGAFQFCPGVYIRRSRNTIPAQPVFPRFGICSEHKSDQSDLRHRRRRSGCGCGSRAESGHPHPDGSENPRLRCSVRDSPLTTEEVARRLSYGQFLPLLFRVCCVWVMDFGGLCRESGSKATGFADLRGRFAIKPTNWLD